MKGAGLGSFGTRRHRYAPARPNPVPWIENLDALNHGYFEHLRSYASTLLLNTCKISLTFHCYRKVLRDTIYGISESLQSNIPRQTQ